MRSFIELQQTYNNLLILELSVSVHQCVITVVLSGVSVGIILVTMIFNEQQSVVFIKEK